MRLPCDAAQTAYAVHDCCRFDWNRHAPPYTPRCQGCADLAAWNLLHRSKLAYLAALGCPRHELDPATVHWPHIPEPSYRDVLAAHAAMIAAEDRYALISRESAPLWSTGDWCEAFTAEASCRAIFEKVLEDWIDRTECADDPIGVFQSDEIKEPNPHDPYARAHPDPADWLWNSPLERFRRKTDAGWSIYTEILSWQVSFALYRRWRRDPTYRNRKYWRDVNEWHKARQETFKAAAREIARTPPPPRLSKAAYRRAHAEEMARRITCPASDYEVRCPHE